MRNLLVLLLGVVILILENSIFNYMNIFKVSINFLLIYMVFVSLSLDKKQGAFTGLILGIIKDISVGKFLGLNAFILFVVGYVLGILKDKVFKENIFTVLVLVIFSTIFDNSLQFLLSSYFLAGKPLYLFVYRGIFLIPLLNLIFSLLLYRPLKRFIKIIESV
ncbi:rod shape-determining protein MreD [Alkalithermobacter thermoalcaliphilus]